MTALLLTAGVTVLICALWTAHRCEDAYMKGYENGLEDAKEATLEILDRKFKRK